MATGFNIVQVILMGVQVGSIIVLELTRRRLVRTQRDLRETAAQIPADIQAVETDALVREVVKRSMVVVVIRPAATTGDTLRVHIAGCMPREQGIALLFEVVRDLRMGPR